MLNPTSSFLRPSSNIHHTAYLEKLLFLYYEFVEAGIGGYNTAFDILRKNCSSLDRVNCEAFFCDAFEELTKIMQKIDEKVYLYFDPPFEIRDGMNDIYQKTFNLLKSLETKKVELATFEHMSKISMPRNIGQFQLIKTKTFGNSSITFYGLEE